MITFLEFPPLPLKLSSPIPKAEGLGPPHPLLLNHDGEYSIFGGGWGDLICGEGTIQAFISKAQHEVLKPCAPNPKSSALNPQPYTSSPDP